MTEIGSVVLRLRRSLDEIEGRLGEAETQSGSLEAFKVTLDDVRTSLLAFAAAQDPAEYAASVRQFRLRRAAQVCQSVLAGVQDGAIGVDTPGFARFTSIVEETLGRVEMLTEGRN
jgi:hypothetical protein